MKFSAVFLLLGALALVGCASDDRPQAGSGKGSYKVGQPYQIDNVWYYPKSDYDYDETGIASWYGPGFHGQDTANGETFNKWELTAAHPTLPMPSLARVTNLENGKSVVVRINDRGPFKAGRIIDVSRRSAQLLGFEQQGTAKVRVQILEEESKALAAAAGAEPAPTTQYASDYTTNNLNRAVETAELAPLPEPPPPPRPLAVRAPPPSDIVTQQPVPTNTNIFVQAGAFTKQQNAEMLRSRLQEIGNTTIHTTDRQGQLFYRVRVGPLANVNEADRVLRAVSQQGVSEPRIVVD